MNKRQIAFKGSFSNGAEHTDYLTIHDNYQGTRRAAVVVDKHAMYTPADIDALIAALREARDALEPPAPTWEETEGGTSQGAIEAEYIKRGLPLPGESAPAAPERAATRLTRAQREALGILNRYVSFDSDYINEHTLKALQRRGLATYSRQYHGAQAQITDAGRAALAAAQRETDDARDATRDGGGE